MADDGVLALGLPSVSITCSKHGDFCFNRLR